MCWSGSLARCVPGGERGGASVYWRELEIPRELVRVREPKRVVLCTFNVYDGPGSLREQRRQRRQRSATYWTQQADRVEATGMTEALFRAYYDNGMPLPGSVALRWFTLMRSQGNARPSNPSYSLVHRHDTYGSESQQMVRSDAVDAYTQDDVGPWLP